MRIDHIAWRVPDKEKLVRLYTKYPFYYHETERFNIQFNDGSTANSVALKPSEHRKNIPTKIAYIYNRFLPHGFFHLAPEIFVSDGQPGSLIDKWVKETNNGKGGIHHIAYQVDDVPSIMEVMIQEGWEFTTQEPIRCPDDDLVQCFTKPIPFMSNIIFEFITRGEKGFCLSSVKKLMESTDVNS